MTEGELLTKLDKHNREAGMTDTPSDADLTRELRQLVAELTLISHVGGTSYEGKLAKATDEAKGGRKPPGSDRDKPQRPREGASVTDLNEYYDAMQSWLESYQRRTPAYFAAEFAKCYTRTRLLELIDEARKTLKAWKKMTVPEKGEEPKSMADPEWKWWVANTDWSVKRIVNRYGCSRQWVHKIRSGEGVHGYENNEPRKAA